MKSGIVMVGDWKKQLQDPLRAALNASVNICGRTAAEACKHAIILMAQSARALTKQSPTKRKIEQDPSIKGKGGQFIRIFKKNGEQSRFFRFAFPSDAEFQTARVIKGRGLARRSWMWGLKGLAPGKSDGKSLPGVSKLFTISSAKSFGYILTDSLHYLTKILPAGWEYTVREKAGNKIMHQARAKIENSFVREMKNARRAGFAGGVDLAKYILRAG